jgi:chromosome segregation ATPase
LSDTIFQSLGRSSRPPEADINDEFSSEVIVYAKPDPDPFSAHATTYYTPQTMIPPTPPKNAAKHTRKTSKEEDLIYTLRTQLALQTELCQQYEVDLRARDELVEALGNRLDFSEKEGERRKGVLKGWKKKVAELERACRHLEEEVDNSRQESVERSIMDEASGEALRMLHRQIAGLEREKSDAERREAALKDEVATLGGLVKERSDDLQRMNEALWNRDESERALKEGIKDAKEQMEMMGNISIGGDEELRALVVKTEQANEEQKDRYRTAESEWEEQRAELSTKVEMLLEDKAASVKELAEVKMILQTREEEHKVLKMELEAQWKHTENASEKIAELEKEKRIIEEEKVALKSDVDILEEKIGALEVEWTEAENRRAGLEADLQELWGDREALEEEKSVVCPRMGA